MAVYRVALKPEDVGAFVFWSKNVRPFLPGLRMLGGRGYHSMLHYTITGLPDHLEPGVPGIDDTVDSFREASSVLSPDLMVWRFDPIILTEELSADEHMDRFLRIADQVKGYTSRCYISFVTPYRKVQRNLAEWERRSGGRFLSPDLTDRLALVQRLVAAGAVRGIRVYSCCGDALVAAGAVKGHCVDGAHLSAVFPNAGIPVKARASRAECGCTESTDIGRYDTCPHGCVYCYANTSRAYAEEQCRQQDPDSPILGMKKEEAEKRMGSLSQRAQRSQSV